MQATAKILPNHKLLAQCMGCKIIIFQGFGIEVLSLAMLGVLWAPFFVLTIYYK